MTEANPIYTGLSRTAWGYFFISIDLKLNEVNILPRFVGYLLLLSAIGRLSGGRRDLKLLRPLCLLLAGWAFADWLLGNIDGFIPFLDLIVAAAQLYFHFQFLTDIAALAERYPLDGGNLPASIRSHRTAYTLMITVIALEQSASRIVPWTWWGGVLVFAAAITCVVGLMIMADLFRLRRMAPRLERGPQ